MQKLSSKLSSEEIHALMKKVSFLKRALIKVIFLRAQYVFAANEQNLNFFFVVFAQWAWRCFFLGL